MSLTDPVKKMSKSTGTDQSRIMLTDSPEEIQKKIMRALTDSETGVTYSPTQRPGVANLLEIAARIEGTTPERSCARYQNASLRALKEDISKTIVTHLGPIRERLQLLLDRKQNSYLDEIAFRGSQEANCRTQPVLERVYSRIGLR